LEGIRSIRPGGQSSHADAQPSTQRHTHHGADIHGVQHTHRDRHANPQPGSTAVEHANRDPHGEPHSDDDTHLHAPAERHAFALRNALAVAHQDTGGAAGCAPDADRVLDGRPNGDADAAAYFNLHVNLHTHCDAAAHIELHLDLHTHGDTAPNFEPDADFHIHSDAGANIDPNADFHIHGDASAHINTHANAAANFDLHVHGNAATQRDADPIQYGHQDAKPDALIYALSHNNADPGTNYVGYLLHE
jgi:hypothetical protein